MESTHPDVDADVNVRVASENEMNDDDVMVKVHHDHKSGRDDGNVMIDVYHHENEKYSVVINAFCHDYEK